MDCPNKLKGCELKPNRADLEKHRELCPFSVAAMEEQRSQKNKELRTALKEVIISILHYFCLLICVIVDDESAKGRKRARREENKNDRGSKGIIRSRGFLGCCWGRPVGLCWCSPYFVRFPFFLLSPSCFFPLSSSISLFLPSFLFPSIVHSFYAILG